MNIEKDLICPNCEGHNLNCTSCQNGIIPSRTLKFIRDKMYEQGDSYCCEYHVRPIGYNSPIVEICFKILKSNFTIYALKWANYGEMNHTNTVDIIDEMLKNNTQGEYESKNSSLKQ